MSQNLFQPSKTPFGSIILENYLDHPSPCLEGNFMQFLFLRPFFKHDLWTSMIYLFTFHPHLLFFHPIHPPTLDASRVSLSFRSKPRWLWSHQSPLWCTSQPPNLKISKLSCAWSSVVCASDRIFTRRNETLGLRQYFIWFISHVSPFFNCTWHVISTNQCLV